MIELHMYRCAHTICTHECTHVRLTRMHANAERERESERMKERKRRVCVYLSTDNFVIEDVEGTMDH